MPLRLDVSAGVEERLGFLGYARNDSGKSLRDDNGEPRLGDDGGLQPVTAPTNPYPPWVPDRGLKDGCSSRGWTLVVSEGAVGGDYGVAVVDLRRVVF